MDESESKQTPAPPPLQMDLKIYSLERNPRRLWLTADKVSRLSPKLSMLLLSQTFSEGINKHQVEQ